MPKLIDVELFVKKVESMESQGVDAMAIEVNGLNIENLLNCIGSYITAKEIIQMTDLSIKECVEEFGVAELLDEISEDAAKEYFGL